MTLAGALLIHPITALLSGGTLPRGFRDYALIIFLGGLPRVLIYFPIFYMRLEGKNTIMLGVMIFFLVFNTALVYLFLFIIPLGVAGAALANVVATVFTCGFALFKLLTKPSSFALPLELASVTEAAPVLKTGTPAALNTLSTAARIIILNLLLLRLTGDSRYLVIFTVLTALTELTVCIAIGIPQTAMPILNVYAEEKSGGAIRLLMRRQVVTGLLVITAVSLLLTAGHSVVAGLYGLQLHLLLPIAMFALSLIIGQVNNIFSCYYMTCPPILVPDPELVEI